MHTKTMREFSQSARGAHLPGGPRIDGPGGLPPIGKLPYTPYVPDVPDMPDEPTVDDFVHLVNRRRLPSGRGGPVEWAWIALVPLLWAGVVYSFLSMEASWFWMLLGALLTARAISRCSMAASEARAALLLPEVDKRWLSALIACLDYPSRSVRSIARLRLTSVLLTVSRQDAEWLQAELLTSHRRLKLYDQLSRRNAVFEPDFVAAVLQFGAMMGDELALAGTEQLAFLRPIGWSQAKVRMAARRWLPVLEDALAGQMAGHAETVAEEGSTAAALPPESGEAGRRLSPEAQKILDEINAETGRSPRMRMGFLLMTWAAVLPYTLYRSYEQYRLGNYPFALVWLFYALVATQFYRLAILPHQALRAGKLAKIEELEAVGPLAEMLAWPQERIRTLAMERLTQLMPQLRASDAHLLSPGQRALLYQTLRLSNARRHAAYLIALLSGLEQVGDMAAIPTVRALAASPWRSLSERRVVEAAAACLPFLESSAQQNLHSQRLLRPSEGAGDSSLLRPLGAAHGAEPEVLLRSPGGGE